MIQNFSKDKLRGYFFGTDTHRDVKGVAEWFLKNGEEKFDKELSVLWNELPQSIDKTKASNAYNRFGRAIEPNNGLFARKRLFNYLFVAVALFTVSVLVWAAHLKNEAGQPTNWVGTQVAYGQIQRIDLPDGSVVWLNSGSKIIYPETFNNNLRQIFVAGEAYIEVAEDRRRPFFLSAGNVNIKVLGTKFNIKSWAEQNRTEISLLEGKIMVEVTGSEGVQRYRMSAGTFMSFNHLTETTETRWFSPTCYSLWKTGGLHFRNLTFNEIAHELERRFDVRIIIRDENIKNERFFASFVNNETLDDILTQINITNSFVFQKNGNIIDVHEKK